MLRLLRTNRISDALEQWLEQNVDDIYEQYGPEWINHALLIRISRELNISLHELVRGTSVYFLPPPPPPPKNPEYVALMQKLRLEAQEREYQRMIHATDYGSTEKLSGHEFKEMKEQVTTIINILVSIAAVAVAFWYWTVSWSPAGRTLASLGAAALTAVAETVVYLGYKRRIQEARDMERSKKEVKRLKQVLLPLRDDLPSEKRDDPHASPQTSAPVSDIPVSSKALNGLRERRPRSTKV